mgnify:FL=1
MTILQNAIARFAKSHNTTRIPVTSSRDSGGVGGFGGFSLGTSSRADELGAMQANAWLFSVINVISTGLSSASWQVFQKETARGTGRVEIFDSPAATLWDNPSPFYTRPEFCNLLGNHWSSVGEMWMVKIRSSVGGIPVELQPVRPDRMFPIASPTNFISGYEYRIGNDRIPLDLDDVIYTRRPSPLDPYRGIGPVGSVMLDISSEKSAAAWTANAFQNDATPGGVLEFDEELDEDEFKRVTQHWRDSHKGVNNARRVAVLERGTYHPISFSPSDMQMNDLRKLNRDLILGAFGMPHSMVGISENVNLANAREAEVIFSRWILSPLLGFLQASLNQYLMPEFSDRERFAFVDPVPPNMEANLQRSVQGQRAGILTTNESRALLGFGSLDTGGDELAGLPFGSEAQQEAIRLYGAGIVNRNESRALLGLPGATEGGDVYATDQSGPVQLGIDGQTIVKAAANPLYPDTINAEENALEALWRDVFAREVADVIEYLSGGPETRSIAKLEPGATVGYPWDWHEKYSAEVEAQLAAMYSEAFLEAFAAVEQPALQQMASTFARERGAQLLRIDGDFSIAAQTRQRVNDLVGNAIDNGDPLQVIQKSLKEDFAFSPARAERVARTETATALGQGQRGAGLLQGRNQKRWRTQGDGHVDNVGICTPNAGQGWIGFTESFQSGHDTIPGHVSCRCTVTYRTLVEDVFCPTCTKRMTVRKVALSPDQAGPLVYCGRCKSSFEVI